MPIQSIHTYLVYPRRQAAEQAIGGVEVPLNGKLFDLLEGIYRKAPDECDIDIYFMPARDGAQQNPCRDLVVAHLGGPTIETGRALAQRLNEHTTNRSGLGLLFLIYGQEGGEHRLVVSRFPTDTGILAEEGRDGLSVEFLERVFMKSAYSYKAALYQHASLVAGFWKGKVVDKQIGNPSIPSSEYWIRDFLHSDFATTPASGTRRLATAIKGAINATADVRLKEELVAASSLARNLGGRPTSVDDFCNRYNLTEPAAAAIKDQLRSPALAAEQFRFDVQEFKRQIAFRTLEVSSGAFLTAEADRFDNIFSREQVRGDAEATKFSTVGTVVGERLRKTKT